MTTRLSILSSMFLGACGGGGGAGGAAAPRPAPTLPPPTPAGASCDAQLEDAAPGNHDRFSFEEGGLEGFKDGAGKVVIAPRFAHVYEFGAGGIAAVIEGPAGVDAPVRLGFIATDGRWLARAYAYDNGPDYFQEGLARIVDDNGKVGFIAHDGTIVIAPTFDGAGSFCHGVTTVHVGGEAWDIDRSGAAVGARRPYVDEPDPCGD